MKHVHSRTHTCLQAHMNTNTQTPGPPQSLGASCHHQQGPRSHQHVGTRDWTGAAGSRSEQAERSRPSGEGQSSQACTLFPQLGERSSLRDPRQAPCPQPPAHSLHPDDGPAFVRPEHMAVPNFRFLKNVSVLVESAFPVICSCKNPKHAPPEPSRHQHGGLCQWLRPGGGLVWFTGRTLLKEHVVPGTVNACGSACEMSVRPAARGPGVGTRVSEGLEAGCGSGAAEKKGLGAPGCLALDTNPHAAWDRRALGA